MCTWPFSEVWYVSIFQLISMCFQPTLIEQGNVVNQICMLCYSSDIDYYSPGQVGRVANCLAPFCICKYIIHEDCIVYLIVHKFADIIGGKGSSACAKSRQLGLFTPIWYSSIVSAECFSFFFF